MRVGLFGGSFNPVHSGHAIILNYLSQCPEFDEIWVLPSRLNPLKARESMISASHRLNMLQLVVNLLPGVKICDIEFFMNEPSYTIDTLRLLSENHPDYKFSIVIGADNWNIFQKWKESAEIIARFGVWIYPRGGVKTDHVDFPDNVNNLKNCPIVQLSSTHIRQLAARGENINYLVPPAVATYIETNRLYNK